MATATDRKRDAEIVQLVTILAEAFGKETSDPMIAAYRIGLEDVPTEAVKRAVTAAIRQSKFMPTVSELRELAGEVRTEDRAVLAFAALDDAVRKHGYYSTVQFDDPVLTATVRALGGWQKVCDVPEKEWFSFFRKRFVETYSAYHRRGVSADLARPLIGYYDEQNALGGYAPQEVKRVTTGLPGVKVLPERKAPQLPPGTLRIKGPNDQESF